MTRGRRTRSPGRCWRSSTRAWTSRGATPWPTTSATSAHQPSGNCGGPPPCRRPPPRRALRLLCPSAPGVAGLLVHGDTAGLDRDLAWQPQLWSGWLTDGHRSTPHPPRENRCATGWGFGCRPAATADLAVRLHPAVTDRHRTARRIVRPPRPAPVAAAPQRRALVGARRRPRGGGAPTITAIAACGTPAGLSDGICVSCSAACRPPGHRTPPTSSSGEDRPDTLLGWLQSDIAANAVRPQDAFAVIR